MASDPGSSTLRRWSTAVVGSPAIRALVRLVPGFIRRKVVWIVVRLTQPWFLVGVCSVLRSPDGRFLAFEHRFWEGVRWGVPSGHMKPYETPARTAARELREECGLEAQDLAVARMETGFEHRVEIWCTGTVDIDAAPSRGQRDTREITDAALLDEQELLRTIRPEQARIVRMILAEQNA